jgi:mitochondrial fission protein ELM1
MIASDRAGVWVLLGPHKGDNDQVIALADAVGIPYRVIQLHYRRFAHAPAALRAVAVNQLEPSSRAELAPPWPSLVLGIGQRSGPVARYIQQESDGRTKIVRLGDPMVSPGLFDLVITTTQYAVRQAPNVVRLPITITNRNETPPDRLEERWLQQFPRPRRLIVIGGRTSLWQFPPGLIAAAVKTLTDRTDREGGSVLAVTSPRTSPDLLAAARSALGPTNVVAGPFPRYGALLSAADEVHVTGDSVSMLSDAVASGKPVGLIRLKPNWLARFLALVGTIRGRPLRIRNLNAFWDDLDARGLAGTIEAPRRGSLGALPLDTAVATIRELIGEPVRPDLIIPLLVPTREARVPAAAQTAG